MIEPFLFGVIIGIAEQYVRDMLKPKPCQHEYRANYYSRHEQVCLDCDKVIPFDATFFPQHQR